MTSKFAVIPDAGSWLLLDRDTSREIGRYRTRLEARKAARAMRLFSLRAEVPPMTLDGDHD